METHTEKVEKHYLQVYKKIDKKRGFMNDFLDQKDFIV
jgi:hypothetical protein